MYRYGVMAVPIQPSTLAASQPTRGSGWAFSWEVYRRLICADIWRVWTRYWEGLGRSRGVTVGILDLSRITHQYLLDLGLSSPDFEIVIWSLFELDRDTLHTRLGSSHECHSGGRRCAFALVSCMPVRLALHRLISSGGSWESHRFRLLRLPRIRIEARASRVRALPDVLS
uniref:Uncharacterized protein n=1 Tax=Ananas comosus var. bracteatus TaxID=296719 RepID=A0A6V7NWM0_ANACO|nr:unnamed protein product [Ananas comosus var. bracteatus]